MTLALPNLQRQGGLPVVEQIAGFYRSAIGDGRLRPGERLPTIRAIADELEVTRSTVQEAYRRLADDGLVQATVGRGTQVTATEELAGDNVYSAGARAAWRQLRTAPQAPTAPPGVTVQANFGLLLPDQELFPVEVFRDAIDDALRRHGPGLLLYGEPMGDPELRARLAARCDCADPAGDADEILVTSGAQQGIDLVLRTFTSPGDAVAVAVPTYHNLFGLLRAHGLDLVPVPHGPGGIDPADLERALARPRVRLLYLMPTFHNPTGRSMDLGERQRLAAVVARSRVPVLEDEFQCELRFAGEPQPSLRSLDPRGLTVTIRTFSKGLFPGVRTGWVRGAAEVVSRMAAIKRLTDLQTSPLLQAALVEFIDRGALDAHLRDLHVELRRRHRAARDALAEHMPEGSTWSEPDGGLALWVELPGVDGDRLASLAAARGVLVTPGRVFTPDGGPSSGVRLSLSRSSLTQIASGIAALGACATELLAQSHPSRRRIYL